MVLHWLTNKNINYPTNMLPLICDCRNLLDRGWEVHVHHVYREANGCADALAKRGTHQHTRMAVYSDCPTFAHVIYVRDGYGLGDFRLCAPGPDVGVVWTWFALNKSPVFYQKKKKRYLFSFQRRTTTNSLTLIIKMSNNFLKKGALTKGWRGMLTKRLGERLRACLAV